MGKASRSCLGGELGVRLQQYDTVDQSCSLMALSSRSAHNPLAVALLSYALDLLSHTDIGRSGIRGQVEGVIAIRLFLAFWLLRELDQIFNGRIERLFVGNSLPFAANDAVIVD